jgi:hypothetical protein
MHRVVEVGVAKGRPTAARHDGGIEGQHGQAKTVPEAGLDLSALELTELGLTMLPLNARVGE